MKQLIVYMGEQRVGKLEQDDSGRLRFRYASEWLDQEDAIPISRMLPLKQDTFEGKQVRPFFAGILPEEEPRRKIASILGISERNDFAMLERIGGECAGAISLLPEDASPFPVENRLRRLSEDDLQAIVADLPRRPLLAGEEGLRLSLAGAQDKLPVVMDGDTISLPLGNTPSSHIMKPQPTRFPGLAANEIFCMRLAKMVGLNVPAVASRPIGDVACIIVERYDRIRMDNGRIKRLHQEDFCQALGFPPERKYQQEGGPLLRDCVTLLREWSTTPVLDIRDFVDGIIFNVLIGNADAHGKNYSMIYDGNQRRLAPFYDLVNTAVWPELSKRLAMNVGKGKNIAEVTPDHFRKMAGETDLGWPMVRERIATMCEKIHSVLKDDDLERWSVDPNMAGKVASLVSQTSKRMQSYLAKQH